MPNLRALRSFLSHTDSQSARQKPTTPAQRSPQAPVATPEMASDLLGLQQQGLTPTTIATAQRTMGNRAVLRMIASRSANHNQGCGCSSCRSVQRQTNQMDESSGGHAHGCGCNVCRTAVQRQAVPGRIQRHSSFEHKMLGDVSPEFLQIISSKDNISGISDKAYEDQRNNQGQVTGSSTIKASGGPYDGKVINKDMVTHVLDQEIARINYFKNQTEPKVKQQGAGSDVESAQNYQRDLRQQDMVRQGQVMGEEIQKGDMFSDRATAAIPNWDVQIVAVSSTKNYEPLLVSYGEMNTLADIYGSTEELKAADPVDRWKIVQGIRQQALFRFLDMKNQLLGNSTNNPYLGQGFTGAYGNTGRGDNALGLPTGEISLALGSKKGAKQVDAYTSALARNACHFAPESWYAWANYHKKGVQLALDGYNLKQQAANAQNPQQKQQMLTQADQNYNDALLENGFGDHYLQDSYAAGHLINKTGIMQEFIKWMDQHPGKWDFMQDKNWRQMQNLAYLQTGLGQNANDDHYNSQNVGQQGFAPKDPQSVENIQDNPNTSTDWTTRFKATGMTLPSALVPGPNNTDWKVLVYLQKESLGLLGSNKTTLKDLSKEFGADVARAALLHLIGQGIVYIDGQSQKDRGEMLRDQEVVTRTFEKATFILDNVYRPSDKGKFVQLLKDFDSNDPQKRAQAKESYEDMAMMTQYNAYHMMLKNTAIQLATNVMHNKYCKEGLEVQAGNGDQLGRIYGDDNMNNKDSQKGVQYSAKTSHMSRDSINDTFANGNAGANTTDAIAARFPTNVKVGGQFKRIDQWHGSQEFQTAMDEEFGGLGTRGKVGALFVKDTLVKGAKNVVTLGLINLGEKDADVGDVTAVVSKDEVHSGDAF